MDSTAVKQSVREEYASRARKLLKNESASCCDAGAASADICCGASNLVSLDQIPVAGEMPDEIVNTSFGCGTPLEIARIQPGETVLDLGSGGGLDCFYASRLVGARGRVIGVDMTPEMLTLAQQNAAKVGARNVEFRKGELENLPIEDATVDVIISNCVINLSPDKDRVFQEAFRVLKPGGRVAFSDMVARVEMPGFLKETVGSWSACVSGAIAEKDYLSKMRAAGFVDVDALRISGGENPIEPVYSAKIVGRKPQ